jgi:hypothetical protein
MLSSFSSGACHEEVTDCEVVEWVAARAELVVSEDQEAAVAAVEMDPDRREPEDPDQDFVGL